MIIERVGTLLESEKCMFSWFIAGIHQGITRLFPLGREAEKKKTFLMILNLVSLNTEEHQALFTISKPGSLHPSLSSCYFRSPFDDSFSHWHKPPKSSTLCLCKYKLWHAAHCFGWETKEKHPPSPLITEIGDNWSFYSISKIPVASKPAALTKSAVNASSSHEVFIIPVLICSATAHWSQIPDIT